MVNEKKWYKDNTYKEALKYKSIKEFRANALGAYKAAWRNNWLKDYTWFTKPILSFAKWKKMTDTEIINYINNTNHLNKDGKRTISALQKSKDKGAYMEALLRGILKLTNLEKGKDVNNGPIYTVYDYCFPDLAHYIGITINSTDREKGHRFDKTSQVYKYSIETGYEIPKPKIIAKNQYAIMAEALEGHWVWKYRELGYKVLNVGPVGIGKSSRGLCNGSLSCYSKEQFIEAAKKYGSKFWDKDPNLYHWGQHKGYLPLVAEYMECVNSKKKIVATDRNGKKTKFNSISEAGKNLGFRPSAISLVLSGRHKSTHGYRFEYNQFV